MISEKSNICRKDFTRQKTNSENSNINHYNFVNL